MQAPRRCANRNWSYGAQIGVPREPHGRERLTNPERPTRRLHRRHGASLVFFQHGSSNARGDAADYREMRVDPGDLSYKLLEFWPLRLR